mmetsp:Transcript_27458/g.65023  ORF Transcript_27458/g.65023 Transcript_27458/m.65023 type:complete len:282 (-) Transcript_27458:854-1699(-)
MMDLVGQRRHRNLHLQRRSLLVLWELRPELDEDLDLVSGHFLNRGVYPEGRAEVFCASVVHYGKLPCVIADCVGADQAEHEFHPMRGFHTWRQALVKRKSGADISRHKFVPLRNRCGNDIGPQPSCTQTRSNTPLAFQLYADFPMQRNSSLMSSLEASRCAIIVVWAIVCLQTIRWGQLQSSIHFKCAEITAPIEVTVVKLHRAPGIKPSSSELSVLPAYEKVAAESNLHWRVVAQVVLHLDGALHLARMHSASCRERYVDFLNHIHKDLLPPSRLCLHVV